MKATLSAAADMVLSRNEDFRKELLSAIEAATFAQQCFLDGKLGRTRSSDELILFCNDRPSIIVPQHEFDAATVRSIMQRWASASG